MSGAIELLSVIPAFNTGMISLYGILYSVLQIHIAISNLPISMSVNLLRKYHLVL
ncbi:MAG: hypothetical protein O7161_03460 [Wolbachia endosymbiont of Halictus tumulorum]|nr:hypothetical protein [Wolbachia endosymbiont of Halictus tumulorum]